MHGTERTIALVFISALLATLLLLPGSANADEAADLARILELNDAYADASRAWRTKEITRAEMQEIQKAIQAESRQINNSYGSIGSPERRAWDRLVLQAKNARSKQKRQEVQATRNQAVAEQRAAQEAERAAHAAAAAESEAMALQEAETQAAAERAQTLESPLVPIQLVYDLQPVDQLQRDALELAPLRLETRQLQVERRSLSYGRRSPAEKTRLLLIEDRLDMLSDRERAILAGYQNDADSLRDLNLLSRALGGDFASIKPEEASYMPAELQVMVADNAAMEASHQEAARQMARFRQRQEWMNLLIGEGGGMLALWVTIVLGIAMAMGAPRGIATLSGDGKTLKLAGWKYSLSSISGILLDSQQHKEETTVIEASGGTGSIVGGYGYITPRKEAVKDVTTFDTLFVRDDAGVEHEIELEDFGLRARLGNRVTIVLADGARAAARPILCYNEDTRKAFTSTRVLRELLKPSFVWALVNAALIYVVATEVALPLLDEGEVLGSVLVSSFCIYWIGGNRLTVAALRAGRFESGKVRKQLIRQLEARVVEGLPASGAP